MHSATWAALLRHIPKDIHDKLMMVTTGGSEIAIQAILRIDGEFLALKGRLAATQDAGRLFFLPFAQIDYLAFQQAVKDSEYEEWFGGLVIPAAADGQAEQGAEPTLAEVAAPQRGATSTGDSTASASPAEAASGSKTVNPVVKSVVLERFRSRGQTSGVRPCINLPKPPK
jgi:hypothetical protein